MSGIKGKILLVVACIIAVLTIASCAVSGFMMGDVVKQSLEATFVTYNWNTIRIGLTVGLAVLAALIALPNVIIARQVSRMYDVSRKYARWSAVTICCGVIILLVTAAAIVGTIYQINEVGTLLLMLLEMNSILPLQIGAGVGVLFLCMSVLLPLLLSLRVRDSVSAMARKRRAHNEEED